MNIEQIEEISRLRSLNLSPKQIARNLKLRPAEVTAILRDRAAKLEQDRAERGEAAPLYNCLVNQSVAKILAADVPNFNGKMNGVTQVFVARIDRQKLTVCSYLTDYWCLGVKNALGPKKMDRLEYEAAVKLASHSFEEDFTEITLVQAQSIVFGAVEYASGLGLDPHPDFAQTIPHLGL
jgi:DNA-binding transcriptional MerR regulator